MESAYFYIYRHITKDTGTTFYIGKGKDRRAYEKRSRNKYWHNIVKKHGFTVEIIKDKLTEKEALELEIKEIDKVKPIANLTNGGQGTSGYKFDSSLVEKRNKANKDLWRDKEWVQKRNKALIDAMSRPEVKEKLLQFQKVRQEKIRLGIIKHPLKGRKMSDDAKKHLSEIQKGEKAYWYGKTTAAAKPVINLNTGQIFKTLKEAANSVNGNYICLSRRMKDSKPYKRNLFSFHLKK